MCPDLAIGSTCLVGDYYTVFTSIGTAMVLGYLFGAVVGVIRFINR